MKKKLMCLCLAVSLLLGIFALAPVTYAASDMKSSEDLLAIIKEFEGFSGTPYLDSDGLYTIGYGTRCPNDKVEQYMQTPMTKEEADAELRSAMSTYETAVNQFIDRHGLTYEQRQFDAVVSLVFNVGPSWLTKGSTLIRVLSNGSTGNELIYGFSIYSMSSGSRSVGHVKRRLAEADMYLNGHYSRTASDNFAYVLYKGNGGTVSTYDVQGYDTTLTATPIPTATREGYEFKGWYTAATGGKLVEVLDETTKNATLYAQWSASTGSETTDPTTPSVPDDDTTVGTPITPVTVTVTGTAVNLREEPSLSCDVIGSANKGDKLTISATHENDGYLWGKFDGGWIALEFTDYQKECVHQYTESSRKEATCITSGSVTYTCGSCSDSYSETIAAKGHNYADATCTAAKKCKTCGVTSGNALGHNYGSDGLCSRCGAKDPNYKVTVTKTYGTVINTDSLNIRKTPDGTIVGALKKGDKVEILEQKTVNGRLWGRCSKGWICLRSYVKLETVEEVVEDTTSKPAVKPTDGVTVTITKTYATIINTDSQNVRTAPDGTVCGTLNRGDKVEILEQKTVSGRLWGRCSKGWICLQSNAKLETVKETVKVKDLPAGLKAGRVTASRLVVRSGAGTANAVVDYLYKGDVIAILEIKTVGNVAWGRIGENRWVSLNHIYVYSIGKVTASKLIVRSGAGSGNAVVDYLYKGDVVVILEVKTVGTTTWGRIGENRWVSMNYINALTAGKVTTSKLAVRSGAGTGNAVVYYVYKNDIVEILETETPGTVTWAKIGENRWVSMNHISKIAGKVTASKLTVRSGAGTANGIVDYLYKGHSVVILEIRTVGSVTWARIGDGRWVSIKYLK